MNEFFTPTPPASDTVPPAITIDSPSNRSNVLSPLSVTGTAFDNIAIRTLELRADGGPWTPATGTTSWSASLTLATGNHTLDARATDFAGNQKTFGISVTVTGQSGIDFVALAPEIAVGLIIAVVAVALILRRRKKREPPGEPRMTGSDGLPAEAPAPLARVQLGSPRFRVGHLEIPFDPRDLLPV